MVLLLLEVEKSHRCRKLGFLSIGVTGKERKEKLTSASESKQHLRLRAIVIQKNMCLVEHLN